MIRKAIDSRLINFGSHKQVPFRTTFDPQEQRYKREMQLKALIHQWLDYQSQLNHNDPSSLSLSKLFISRTSIAIKQLTQLNDNNEEECQQSISLQSNPLSISLIQTLYRSHPFFKRINFNLAETLINIGVFSLYKRNQSIPNVFYNDKFNKNRYNQIKRLGFIIYGKLKLSNKLNHYEKIITQNQTIGQHAMESLNVNFTDFKDIKIKSVDEETAILWIAKNHYQVFVKQSIKCGLKEQLKKLESHLKLSWINKAIKKF